MDKQYLFRLFAGIVACAAFAVFDSPAQSYPLKPVHMLVGFTAGGSTDVTARMVAQKLSETLGRSVVVENRPGASGSIAIERVVASAADGYTLLVMSAGSAIQPALRVKLPYDLGRDLAPVSLLVVGPYLLVVHPSVPARNVKELIALARSQRGKLNYGSSGSGSSAHLAAALFNLMAKINIVHVPYKGAAEFVIANAAGDIDMSFSSISAALPLMGAGKLRPLAVSVAKRVSLMPTIPTVAESGLPGYDRSSWIGVLAPAGVPKDIIARLNAAIGKVVNTPEMTESLFKQGLEPQTNTPEQFAALLRNELAQNVKLIELAGVKAE